jgi:hypothetical protein
MTGIRVRTLVPKDLSQGPWRFLEASYPVDVVALFRAIAHEVARILPECGLAVLGSFSRGTAQIQGNRDGLVFVSDVDLLATMRASDLPSVLTRRSEVESALAGIESQVRGCDRGFHIGLRFRSYAELGGFIQKLASVGYDLERDACWIVSPHSDAAYIVQDDYGPGHCAENICNMLWVVLRYSLPSLWRRAERANECINAAVRYLPSAYGSIAREAIATAVNQDRRELQTLLLRAGEFAVFLSESEPASCQAAAQDEEFDCLRASTDRPSLVPRFLVAALRTAWNLEQGCQTDPDWHEARRLAQQLGLSHPRTGDLNTEFRRVREPWFYLRLGECGRPDASSGSARVPMVMLVPRRDHGPGERFG